MRSTEPLPPRAPKAGAEGPGTAQQDDQVGCVIAALESNPESLDWDGLIASGNTPCLALGAERRTKRRD